MSSFFVTWANASHPITTRFPLLVFWGLMLVWLFPWSAFVFQSLAQVPHRWREWRSGMNRRQRAHAALCRLGGGDPGVLQLLHSPGVLRHPRATRTGFADRRLAATGRGIARQIPSCGAVDESGRWYCSCSGSCRLRSRDVSAGPEQEHACRQRPRRPAQKEPERIRAGAWDTFSISLRGRWDFSASRWRYSRSRCSWALS